jgi:hypothetical protein
MTKFSREMQNLTIGNAGSKNVPVLLIGSGKTRSGHKFRNRLPKPADVQSINFPQPIQFALPAPEALAHLPHPQPLFMGSIPHHPSPTSPPYTPTESAYWDPREGPLRFDEDDESTEDVPSEEESMDEQTQITKVWRFDPACGWYIRSYRANL